MQSARRLLIFSLKPRWRATRCRERAAHASCGAAKGKGKSGGARAITFYSGRDLPVFLMTVFGKGEKANLTKTEQNELRDVLARIAAEYRKGVRRRV